MLLNASGEILQAVRLLHAACKRRPWCACAVWAQYLLYELSEEGHEDRYPPAPSPIAVAAPTAFARVSSAGMLCLRVYPMTIAAAKLSPQPTVSATATCSHFQVSELPYRVTCHCCGAVKALWPC